MEVGSLLAGKYRLVRLLGDGGMGTVYEARHEVLGTSFAIKILHPDLTRRSGLVERFLREAHVSAQIKSPHVVQVFDVDRTSDGTVYIVMELLGGEPLARILDRDMRLPVATAVDFGIQILEALVAAHALGVIHRDLKPENVFLVPNPPSSRPLVKLIDFGIAKLKSADPTTKNLTAFGTVMGTPEYMAPEQAFSAERADARSDLYAVGVMIYEMLAGARPAAGEDAAAVAAKVHRGEVTPLVHAAPHIPRELAGLVHRAMAPRPELRFGSAEEMATALRTVSAQVGVPLDQTPGPSLFASTQLARPMTGQVPMAQQSMPQPPITGHAQRTAMPDRGAPAVSPGPPQYGYTPQPPMPSYPEAPIYADAPGPRRKKKSKLGWIIAIPLLLGIGAAVVTIVMQQPDAPPPSPFPTATTTQPPVATQVIPTTPTVTTGSNPLPPLVETRPIVTPTVKPAHPDAGTAPRPGSPDAGPTTGPHPPSTGPIPPFPSTFPSSFPFPLPSTITIPSGFPPIPSVFPFPPIVPPAGAGGGGGGSPAPAPSQ